MADRSDGLPRPFRSLRFKGAFSADQNPLKGIFNKTLVNTNV